MLSEQTIIQQLANAFPDINGIGDDAAILPLDDKRAYVISKDVLNENIHFKLDYYDPISLAHKALHANLSDIAAMGGTPKFVLLGLSVPSSLSSDWLHAFLAAFSIIAKQNQITLIGGDTVAASQHLSISITIIGEAELCHLKKRNAAKPSDAICIIGNLADAHLGLLALENNISALHDYKIKALQPMAKIKEGEWLGKQTAVHAMMDISDGLYLDLSRLCTASQMGATVQLTQLPHSANFFSDCDRARIDPFECLLIGGEDYTLLCTIAKSEVTLLQQRFQQQFTTPFTIIGEINSQPGIQLYHQDKIMPFSYKPFTHFYSVTT